MGTVTAPHLSSAVENFFAEGPLSLFIGGKWVAARSGRTFQVMDPGTAGPLAVLPDAGPEDVDAAVRAAQSAFQNSGWATMDPSERSAYLLRLADLVEQHKDTLAEIESLDVGKPLPQAHGDIQNFADTMRYYARLAVTAQYSEELDVPGFSARIVRHPYGVCAFILPWNFPFLLVGWNISPALAAGNTVIIKPPEDAPMSTVYLMRLVREAGIPDGVVNLLTGLGETTGAALSGHPGLKRMGFTGSPEVGRMIAAKCGQNLVPVKLELGGKGAAVIFEDSPIEATVNALAGALTLNCGQVCCTATRWAVHESIFDSFLECAIARLGKVNVGYGRDPLTEMGPLISRKQMNRVLGYIGRGREQGAQVPLEGGQADVPGKAAGFYVKPAILTGSADNVAACEEIFGPVTYLLKFRTEDEAEAMINSSQYGLANSVWSRDLDRANRVAEKLVAGNSWINAHNLFPHGVPYAGVNLSGMGGGVLSPKTFYDYLRDQSVLRPLG